MHVIGHHTKCVHFSLIHVSRHEKVIDKNVRDARNRAPRNTPMGIGGYMESTLLDMMELAHGTMIHDRDQVHIRIMNGFFYVASFFRIGKPPKAFYMRMEHP